MDRSRTTSSSDAVEVRIARALPVALLLVFFFPALFVASIVPYRDWDSLAFGVWSRLIADHSGLFPSGLLDLQLNRPLFHVVQGLVWLVVGYHEWVGRWLSVLFALLYVLGVLAWGRALQKDEPGRAFVVMFAIAIALGSSTLAIFVGQGLTDIPVAAMATITAVLLWSNRLGRARLPLVALAAAATVLAKPTGFLAPLGLALAWAAYVAPSERRKFVDGVVALAVGALAGLTYDIVQAARLGENLVDFLRAGTGSEIVSAAGGERWDVLFSAEWLGEALGLVIVYGLVYGAIRATSDRARLAPAVAGPVAFAWSLAGPPLADGSSPFPSHGSGLGLAAWIAVAAAMLAAPFTRSPVVVERRVFLTLSAAALLPLIVWVAYRPDQPRLLSPAWAPLTLLAGAALAEAALGLATVWRPAVLVPMLGSSLLVVGNVVNIDHLGRSGWSDLLGRGWGGWTSAANMENFAYGSLREAKLAAELNRDSDDRVLSNDGRFVYFFPGLGDVGYPTSCAELRPFRIFVLLTAGDAATVLERKGGSTDPLAWLQCRSPAVHEVDERPGAYVTFAIGAPAAVSGDCAVGPSSGEKFDAVVAEDVSYREARKAYERAAGLGFTGGLRIEHTGCDRFRVLLTGVPSLQDSIREEAASLGLRLEIVPAIRYPEVAADVPPIR